jgi:TolB-like protein
MSLVAELRRRNVFRVAAAYLVVGWLLTEVLTTILPTLGAPEWTARAVILMFAFGFIPAVVFSWFFELTPEGIKHEHEVIRDESRTPHTGKKLDYVTVAAVIVGIVFIALFSARTADDDVAPPVAAISNASVAVLPFVNMSNDKDNEYFSDGLTETLLHMLAQVPGLKVAARTSSFAFKGQSIGIQEIAAALKVAHILEGSVQRVGDRVRITAQLIRADDGFHVWSETYDRTLDDIFGIQDEIAGKVGSALSVSLLGASGGGGYAAFSTANPDAYDLYLQALNERATFSYGGLQAAEGLLKGALTIDPDFLDAKTALANNYLSQIETGLMGPGEGFAEVVVVTEQVLVERPSDVGARATQLYAEAIIQAQGGRPDAMVDVIPQLEELVAEEPDLLQPRSLLTRTLRNTQRFDDALTVQLESLDRDPLNAQILYELGVLYSLLEQWDEARSVLERSLDIEPAQPNAYVSLARVSLQAGDGLDYVQQFLKAVEVDPKDHELAGFIAMFLYNLGLIEEGDDFRDRIMAIAPTSEIAYLIQLRRAIATGDEEASVAIARRAVEDDIDDRQFAYGSAVQHLLRVAARNGTVEDVSAYLEEHAPGLLDIEAASVPGKYRDAQFSAFDAWYTTLPREELLQRLDRLREVGRSYGADPMDNPGIQFGVFALLGDTEAAIEVALEKIVDDTVLVHPGWRQILTLAQYKDIVADSRIQVAMQRWETEEAAVREQIRVYLADLHAAT